MKHTILLTEKQLWKKYLSWCKRWICDPSYDYFKSIWLRLHFNSSGEKLKGIDYGTR